MVQGTCSGAGKSIIATALCRIFMQDGYSVAPFKSQNMALNSFVTLDGLEMGRAQAVQAEAAGILPDTLMNPILLKPTSDSGSQLIVNGVPKGNFTAKEYWNDKKSLIPVVEESYRKLAEEYEIVVIEGAGSPAEINLKKDDFVNMGMARIAAAPVILVGDIDRGGVFASLYGTVKLLEYEEQERIAGLVINKFRGDPEILNPGLIQLEGFTGKKVLGVVPYFDLDIDDEDSISERLSSGASEGKINIAVVRLPWLSNYTDFSSLKRLDGVMVYYATKPSELENADMIIIPGTKNTLADMIWLRETEMESQIIKSSLEGTVVFGICGGYQIMGQTISDAKNYESGGTLRGMGLLPVDTVFRETKKTLQTEGTICQIGGVLKGLSGMCTKGYEIHMGETIRRKDAKPFQIICSSGKAAADGCYKDNAYGTYQHGIFDKAVIAEKLAGILAERKGIKLRFKLQETVEYRKAQYDKLADIVRKSLDMEAVYRILEGGK